MQGPAEGGVVGRVGRVDIRGEREGEVPGARADAGVSLPVLQDLRRKQWLNLIIM